MLLSTKTFSIMQFLSVGMCTTQPEGGFLQMTENLLSRGVVTIDFRDHLFDLLRHQSADRGPMLCSEDLHPPDRGLVELNRKILSGHARILRGARNPRQSREGGVWRREWEFNSDRKLLSSKG